MANKKYSENEVEQIRQLKHLPIKEIAARTKRTINEVVYIKQKYKIYKDWQTNS